MLDVMRWSPENSRSVRKIDLLDANAAPGITRPHWQTACTRLATVAIRSAADSQYRFKNDNGGQPRMKARKSLLCLLLLATLILPLSSHAKDKTTQSLTSLVTGTIASGGTFTGLLNINNFTVQNGALTAIGTLSGTLTDALGNVIGTVSNIPVAIPVSGLQASCPILSLNLGPLHLNLLGLVVDLNQVVLNVVAQSGAGNLLGNLLCAVSNLLNSGGAPQGLLQGVASLLNQILAGL
jgi:hypothetical protein